MYTLLERRSRPVTISHLGIEPGVWVVINDDNVANNKKKNQTRKPSIYARIYLAYTEYFIKYWENKWLNYSILILRHLLSTCDPDSRVANNNWPDNMFMSFLQTNIRVSGGLTFAPIVLYSTAYSSNFVYWAHTFLKWQHTNTTTKRKDIAGHSSGHHAVATKISLSG